jgi:hypothetical protein
MSDPDKFFFTAKTVEEVPTVSKTFYKFLGSSRDLQRELTESI